MSERKRIAVIVGSLRTESLSRRLARVLMEHAPPSLDCAIVEIGDLPLYNEDLETGSPPSSWSSFRAAMRKADGILFVTPEYNRSIPGCLKNAIDVGSRPADQNVFAGMPAAVVSQTPYKLGGFGANHALRQTFVFLDMPVMQQPEAYFGTMGDALDDAGKVKDPEVEKLIGTFMSAFDQWVITVHSGAARHDFEAFLRERRRIATEYANGNAAPLDEIATRLDPATFFSPKGDTQLGAAAIMERYGTDARSFARGGQTKLDVLQSGASGDLAFWSGLQRAQVRMSEGGKEVSMTLRITEVFRFEEGGFKLVHRHADPAGERKSD